MPNNLLLHSNNLVALQYLLDNGFKGKTSFPPNSNNKTTSVEKSMIYTYINLITSLKQ
jgi:hypothetical protein